MPSARKITVTLHSLTRIGNTINANPRWRLVTSEGEFITQSDASVAYGIENDSPVGKEVEITLSRAGRVTGLRIVTPT